MKLNYKSTRYQVLKAISIRNSFHDSICETMSNSIWLLPRDSINAPVSNSIWILLRINILDHINEKLK